jgi:hypothetical protein
LAAAKKPALAGLSSRCPGRSRTPATDGQGWLGRAVAGYDPERYAALGREAWQQYLPPLLSVLPQAWSDQRKLEVAEMILAVLQGFRVDWLTSGDTARVAAGFEALTRALEREEAQLISLLLICFMTTSPGAPTVARRIHLCDMISAHFPPGPQGLPGWQTEFVTFPVPEFELGTDGPLLILVGVDGSRTSLRAAAYAAGLARRQHARLLAVYVTRLSASVGVAPGAAPALSEAAAEAANELERQLRDGAARLGLDMEFRAVVGEP